MYPYGEEGGGQNARKINTLVYKQLSDVQLSIHSCRRGFKSFRSISRTLMYVFISWSLDHLYPYLSRERIKFCLRYLDFEFGSLTDCFPKMADDLSDLTALMIELHGTADLRGRLSYSFQLVMKTIPWL